MSSDERERERELERERDQSAFCVAKSKAAMIEERERERERERRPLFFPPLKVLFLFLLFFALMTSIFSTKKTRALLKVKKKEGAHI